MTQAYQLGDLGQLLTVDAVGNNITLAANSVVVGTAVINSTSFSGIANNTSFVGTVSAANVVSNAQLSANLSNYQTTAGLSNNVLTLTANNTNFVGSVSAANVVSNAQLTANLANYQTTAGLSNNVLTLTANNTNFVGTVSAANVVSNAQLTANLANYQTTAGLTANIASYLPTYAGVVNASSHTVGTAFIANNSQLTITTPLSANGSVGTAGYVLTSNGATGSPYWAVASAGVNVAAQYTWTNAHTFSNTVTHNGNVVIGTSASFSANGTIGTAGQVLTSNGTTVYWSTVSGGGGSVNTAAAYTWTNTQTFSNPVVINGALTVGTSSAIRRAVFANGEINFVPYTTAESSSSNTQYYMNLCDSAGNNGSLMSLNIRGLASGGSAGATLAGVSMTTAFLGVSGDVITNYSDIRLKDVSGPVTNALEKVNSLTGFYYTPNDLAIELGVESTKLNRVGISAQDLQLVLPEAVRDAPGANGYLTVQYERIVPLLIEAIKELKTEINELKAK